MKISELFEDITPQKQNAAGFIKKTYGPKWNKLPGFDDIDKFIEKLAEVDPSRNGSYMRWLAKCLINDPRDNHVEDLGTIGEELRNFERFKPKIPNKDINSYKNFSDLYAALQPFTKKPETEEEKKSAEEKEKALAEYEKMRSQIITVYNGSEGWIRIPKTKAAACYLGQNTKWCTAATTSHNHFDGYKSDKLFVIYSKSDKSRVQLHIKTGQLADVLNRQIGMSNIPKWSVPHIIQWYKDNPENMTLKHVMTLGSHDPSIAKGTQHEDVLKLMQKYGV